MVRPITGSAHVNRSFDPVVSAHADGWFASLFNSATVDSAHAVSGTRSGRILRIVVLAHVSI